MKFPNNNCSILISSCDKYEDLWLPFFKLFFKYWEDCPFTIYLGTNYKIIKYFNVNTINIGKDITWSYNLKSFLDKIHSEYIILFLEDFFIRKKVNTSSINSYLSMLIKLNGDMMRLITRPGPDIKIKNYTDIGLILKNAPWRISTQVSIWKKEYLVNILKSDENIWEFEYNGSLRSNKNHNKLYCVRKSVINYGHHVIERGKWFPIEYYRFKKLKILNINITRPIMSYSEYSKWLLNKMFSIIFEIIPWYYRNRIYKIGKLIKMNIK